MFAVMTSFADVTDMERAADEGLPAAKAAACGRVNALAAAST